MHRNELVPLSPDDDAPEANDGGDIWDRPPTDSTADAAALRRRSQESAALADRQAARGRAVGDETYASIREEDAKDLRQRRWGSGDARTWAWVALMFFGLLLYTALLYYLPYGRHAAPPPVRVY